MAKMTLTEKLAQAQKMVEKYQAELAAAAIRDNIEPGDEVTFTFGRGETKKTLVGTVVGVKDDTNGRWVAITAGEGFDLQKYTVRTADISANPAADARNAAPVGDEAAPAEPVADKPAKGAAKDPLEQI